MIVQIYVPLEGVPKGSMRAFRSRKSSFTVVTDQQGAKLKNYQAAIAQAWVATGAGTFDGPIEVDVLFVRALKKSTPKTYRPYVTTSPDGDKTLRAVCDGLQGFAYKNDAQIVSHRSRKMFPKPDSDYQYPGTYITVRAGKDVSPELGEFSPKANIDQT